MPQTPITVASFLSSLPSIPRLLEEGSIEEAEAQKQRIERLQREKRRVLEENGVEHQPRFFRFVPEGGGGDALLHSCPESGSLPPLWFPAPPQCLSGAFL